MKVVSTLIACVASTQLADRAVAKAFVHANDDPSVGELAELKTANPMAYGIVMGLLKKKQMGMPLSKFEADHKNEVMPLSASGEDSSSEEVPTTGHVVDHWHWKPPTDGAETAGFLATKSKQETTETDTEEDKDSEKLPSKINFDWSYSKPAQPAAAPKVTKASMQDENPYSKYFN
mmetsp:Transcript_98372/g.262908  ORF Transcript_98372/g.262908 Transcript_98372/m.262908 type:complete len:176 (-) Transcript_98372:57-584(-)